MSLQFSRVALRRRRRKGRVVESRARRADFPLVLFPLLRFRWFNFMILLENPDFHGLPFVKSLSLLEGYAQPADICMSGCLFFSLSLSLLNFTLPFFHYDLLHMQTKSSSLRPSKTSPPSPSSQLSPFPLRPTQTDHAPSPSVSNSFLPVPN